MTTCPQGHQSSAEDYCDVCGTPIATAPPSAAEPQEAPVGAAETTTATTGGRTCPHCGAGNVADALFCEACGYDFTTGTVPRPGASSIPTPSRPDEVGEPAAVPPPDVSAATQPPAPTPSAAAAEPTEVLPPTPAPAVPAPQAPPPPGPSAAAEEPGWVVEIWVDPDWYALQDSADPLPSPGLPEVRPLRQRSLLVGRVSRSRGIHPDIDCETDSGVSRRQAQLTTDGTRWFVEDLQSANGTFVGPASGPLPSRPITPGQRVEVGPDDRLYVGAWTRMVLRRAAPGEVAGLG